MTTRTRLRTGLLLLLFTAISVQPALALISGGEGNDPHVDPGWPQGAAAIFNAKSRIAYWVGPPFGGGQWHAECRGDAQALSAVLADFAKLDVKSKRVVLHDGVGHSFWLNPNGKPEKQAAAKMDWEFMVWEPSRWAYLRKLPAEVNPIVAEDAEDGPLSQIDVYTEGNVKWADVVVPQELKIVDERLVAHGFTPADGIVLEGKITDLATGQPIAAKMVLERIEPQPKGGYRYTNVAEAAADAQGHWVLKHAPTGWYRVLVQAEGFVPRLAGYAQLDDQPHWRSYDCGLSRPASVSGRVTDDAGQPLAGVEVRIRDVTTDPGGRYESASDYACQTDAEGRFHTDQVPIGRGTIWLNKTGYCHPGLGEAITMPKHDLELSMKSSARLVVTVDFTGTQRPAEYLVEMAPEGGNAIGSYGGSAQIDAKNQFAFTDVPPGRYVVQGHPNPSSGDQQAKPITVDLKGGQTTEVTLHAK